MVDALREVMTTPEQTAELARLDAEIESLQRAEESLIELAFANGTDVLRRSNANPACVLSVRVRAAAPVVRPARRPRPDMAAAAE
jgi:hypothetical protein